MPRKSKHHIPAEKLELLRGIIEGYNVQTTADLQEALKDLLGGAIQTMLEEEIDCQIEEKEANEPGYHDARNGYKTKRLRSSAGEIPISAPQDRNSDFEPVVVGKYQRDISELEGKIIAMYARGLSTRQISDQIGLLLFSLSGFSRDMLNRHALLGIHCNALRQTGNLRRVKCADEIIVDFKLLCPALLGALRLMDNNLLHKLIEDNGSKLLNIGVFLDRSQKAGRAVLVPFHRVNLCLRGGNFLFEGKGSILPVRFSFQARCCPSAAPSARLATSKSGLS